MKTHRLLRATSLSALALFTVAGARAQTWDICISQDPGAKLHDDAFLNLPPATVVNPLIGVTIGAAGSTSYGGTMGNCFAPNAITGNARGRFCFFNGSTGSVQSTIDNNMALTFGAPRSPGGSWGYATIQQSDVGSTTVDSTLFGTNGFNTFFTGESDTYVFARTTNGNVRADVRWDVIGDAVRIQWDLTNTATTTRNIGMQVGHWVAMIDNQGDIVGFNSPVFVDVPGIRPPRVERRFTRTSDPSGYPAEASFLLSQSEGYGLRVNNTATAATTDTADNSQSLTNTDGFVLGRAEFLLGAPASNDVNSFPNFIFQEPISDVEFRNRPAYIQTYSPQAIAAGATRRIIQFYNSPWSDATYGRPYSVVVDKPRVLNLSSSNAEAFEQGSYTVRVYVDNNRGFATVDRELPLEQVNVSLTVGDGLNVVGASTRQISRIDARRLGFVDFTISPDATANGDIPYTVTVTPSPGSPKTVTGTIRATSQPRLPIYSGANLITEPFNFANPVWEEILSPLEIDSDYQAFTWDPEQAAYVVQTGPQRGKGTWIVSRANRGVMTLASEPTAPTDQFDPGDGSGGAPLITLKQGWNLIGNPYPISIPISQIVGSSNANTAGALTFSELVQQGIVSGTIAYWDNPNQTYKYIQSSTGRLEPQRGYWVYVTTRQNVIIRFPAVYQVGYRAAKEATTFAQSDKQWRLQLSARNGATADDQNFVGLAKTADVAKTTRIYEPPMAPVKGALSVSVQTDVDGQTRSLAQSLSSGGDRQTFKVRVESRDAGPVTLTWPNLSTIPKTIRARLVDKATGETRDLRKFSGYTFTAESRSTRDLEISVEPGNASRVVIGNIVAVRDSRDGGPNAPFTINYTLAADATTSVRILGANGREVYSATRGRADKAGSNSVVWNLRDNANRAVAPGTYRVEVVAEGDNGERVRKFYPINLVR